MSMSVSVGQKTYEFDGPFSTKSSLKSQSGVYLISTKNPDKHKVLDIGESGNVADRVLTHDRESCWTSHAIDGVYYSAYYCDESTRMSVKTELRDAYNPTCGDN